VKIELPAENTADFCFLNALKISFGDLSQNKKSTGLWLMEVLR
jgi:hypothetical protein